MTLNPGTPVSLIEPVLHLADLVLVMSVNPGFSNQAFLPDMVAKVAQVRRKLDEIKSSAYLEVDGGINADNLPSLIKAGANVFVTAHAHVQPSAGDRGGDEGFARGYREDGG